MNERQIERLIYLLEQQNELLMKKNKELERIGDALFKIYGGMP